MLNSNCQRIDSFMWMSQLQIVNSCHEAVVIIIFDRFQESSIESVGTFSNLSIYKPCYLLQSFTCPVGVINAIQMLIVVMWLLTHALTG